METKNFKARLDLLRSMLSWINEHAKMYGFSEKDLQKIELCSEEVIVNILHHSGIGKEDQIELTISDRDGSFLITFKNKGKDFDPTKNIPKVKPEQSLEEREAGGLGLFFIAEFMDDIVYERKGAYNVLTLEKRISTGSSQSK